MGQEMMPVIVPVRLVYDTSVCIKPMPDGSFRATMRVADGGSVHADGDSFEETMTRLGSYVQPYYVRVGPDQ